MDFTKFVSLLDARALFFSRADLLSDAWEGAHTVENLRRRPALFGISEERDAKEMQHLSQFYRALRVHTFVSCWHLNDVESTAMWKLYVSHNRGVAVQSTFQRLVDSFQGDENSMFSAFVGKIRYLDYERQAFSDGNTFVPFLHKRSSFEHEHELRAIIQPISPGSGPPTESNPFADGILVDVDLKTLIERVYVAPTSEAWFAALVEKIARKYGLEVPIEHSDLARDPLF
jgi:hypothetical protein